jgi:transposase InsO family protein
MPLRAMVSVVEQRLEVLQEAQLPGRSVAQVCARHGISRQTFYNWKKAYDAEGLPGLLPASRRPHRSPHQLDPVLEERIWRLRKEHGWGPRKLRDRLRLDADLPALPSISTVQQVLARHGDGALRVSRPRGTRYRYEGQRFTYPHPNQLWQIDGAMHHLADGTPFWAVDIVDDHSRFCVGIELGEALTSTLAWAAIRSAVAENGQPATVLSDNGLCFTGRLRATTVSFERQLARAGIGLIHSRPYNPRCCGKIERLHQTTRGWLARRRAPRTMAAAENLFAEFREHYNHIRPHQALDGELPVSCYHAGTAVELPVLEVEPADAVPLGALTRKLNSAARFSYGGVLLRLDSRFAGLSVGLVRDRTRLHVYYGSSRLATFQLGVHHPHPTR